MAVHYGWFTTDFVAEASASRFHASVEVDHRSAGLSTASFKLVLEDCIISVWYFTFAAYPTLIKVRAPPLVILLTPLQLLYNYI